MQRAPVIEVYFRGLILFAFCVVAAWTFLVGLFTVTGWLSLAQGFRQTDGLLSESIGPLMVLIGSLILGCLWKLLRFVRKHGMLYRPE